jgi:hypothetical protein
MNKGEPTFAYDEQARKGVITFPNGHQLTIGNVDRAKAEDFYARHAAEFMKRDCILHTSACFETRSEANG